MMFGLFKSNTPQRRNEAWMYFHADLIRQSIQDAWAVEQSVNDAPDYQRLQDRLFSETFAGYLVGFADVLVAKIADDEPARMRYSQMLFDCVLTERGGQWVRANVANYLETQPADFAAGFSAGRDDARDFTSGKVKALARLGKLFLYDKGLAA